MKIETKRNVNEDVYVIQLVEKKWKIVGFNTIQCIKISAAMYSIFIKYLLLQSQILVDEENCFATKEDAQQECDRRNNG